MDDRETWAEFADDTADRRVSRRVPFGAVLGISEFEGGKVPPQSAFRAVKGFNLSQTGISFAASEWPQSDQLVVMLGDPERPAFVVTRIVGCIREEKEPGARPFKVHCEFEEWIAPA